MQRAKIYAHKGSSLRAVYNAGQLYYETDSCTTRERYR